MYMGTRRVIDSQEAATAITVDSEVSRISRIEMPSTPSL